ncbi:hypothetical protein FIBSPDRAFT_926993, partial [Athelia psychrophila]
MFPLIEVVGLLQNFFGQTRRWEIAWSFGHVRLPDRYAYPSSESGTIEWWTIAESNAHPEYLPWPFALPRAMLHERLVLALDVIEGTSQTPMSVPDGAGDAGGSNGLQMSASRDTWEPLGAHLSEDWGDERMIRPCCGFVEL